MTPEIANRSKFVLPDYLYVFSFLLANISYIIFGASTLDTVFDVHEVTTPINILVYIILIYVIILEPKSLKNWILSIISIAVGLLIYFLSSEGIFLLFILLIIGKTNLSFKNIIFFDFLSKLFATLSVMLLGASGIIPTLIATRGFGSDNTLRHSLGFTQYNVLGALILSMLLEWIYIRSGKFGLFDYLGSVAILILLNNFVDSRSSVIIGVVGLILNFSIYFVKIALKKKFFRIIIGTAYIEVALISILIANSFQAGIGTGIWDRVNALLSSRISIAQFYLQSSGFSILPKELPTYLNTGVVVLDNTYIYLGIKLGIIALVIFLVFMTILGRYLVVKRDYYGVIIFICFAIYGIMESTLFYCSINFLIVFLAANPTWKQKNKGRNF
ncbi:MULTISPECIES: hypothetical protein [Lactiplantibacillus]|uniref:hypothetical protein n=1 Tax=Lactiplantibacillus TaxID=2767842 RepID=UPI001C1EA4C8|nr:MULTISPECIES: hypothetical protein [Lactiplantibacillus]MBU7478904.1 hypothetical protein [Lactiplantibacillus pentosus]MBU7536699.1 hypothetical protein [Lactiplantibacillus pentosus]MDG2545353.1 hypothetical protein [Lactiplantibacillus plantarum]MDT7037174.1 hypothetical protein [Lactiplantibacillus pentosus]